MQLHLSVKGTEDDSVKRVQVTTHTLERDHAAALRETEASPLA